MNFEEGNEGEKEWPGKRKENKDAMEKERNRREFLTIYKDYITSPSYHFFFN